MRPNLSPEGNESAINHVQLEKVPVGDVFVLPLELAHVFDVLQLRVNETIVHVSLGMDQGQDAVAIIPAIAASKPARWLRKEEHGA